MQPVRSTAPPRLARWSFGPALLALAAVLVLAAGCGNGGDEGPAQDAAAPADSGAFAPAPDGEAQAAQPAPQQPVPGSPEDIARITQDSIQEARLFRRRQASMESYESCMAKVQSADPPQRGILEAACKRSRGASR